MNTAPSSERINITLLGSVNSGKSSLMNALTSQDVSIVSDIKGTTTDPVHKAMEILPLGAVMLHDTAGFDDDSQAGSLRMKKTFEAIRKTDIAVIVKEGFSPLSESEKDITDMLSERNIPYIIAHSKCDIHMTDTPLPENEIKVSAADGSGIDELRKLICSVYIKSQFGEKKPLSVTEGLAERESLVILVTPIDASAPKGRLILPQVQTLRSLLDTSAVTITVQPSELSSTLSMLNRKPDLVITDSQVFSYVKDIVPDDINLTSFSILFARYKGILDDAMKGIEALKNLRDGDCVLISEGCTHHRQCGDIGRDKLPLWIEKFTGKKPVFEFSSGGGFPENLKKYSLVVHCGGCMLSFGEMDYRRTSAKSQGIPFTNYGILIAAVNGILERCTFFAEHRNTD